jgi:hypothetical protein
MYAYMLLCYVKYVWLNAYFSLAPGQLNGFYSNSIFKSLSWLVGAGRIQTFSLKKIWPSSQDQNRNGDFLKNSYNGFD